jgi:hypothetical protein
MFQISGSIASLGLLSQAGEHFSSATERAMIFTLATVHLGQQLPIMAIFPITCVTHGCSTDLDE